MLLSQGPVHALLTMPTQAACQTLAATGKRLRMLRDFGSGRISSIDAKSGAKTEMNEKQAEFGKMHKVRAVRVASASGAKSR
jgi:hypothetical protein